MTIAAAFAQWRVIRAEYEDYLEAAYALAAEETRGALLNRRGMAAGIESRSLFMGNRARAYAYASPELIEHWDKHPRVPFVEYEAQRTDPHDR
jgi:hypothetical protein